MAMLTYDEALALLRRHGQEHVLRFWEQLTERERAELLVQVSDLDFERLSAMRALLNTPDGAASQPMRPAPVLTLDKPPRPDMRAHGEALLRAGRVGAILVAGGQGSRLGYDGPKGCFPIGPVSDASLFEVHARKILALRNRYGRPVPLYIMTSRRNDAPTRAYFESHGWFGLDPDDVVFFQQGMWPAMLPDGRLVLEKPGSLFTSPDGHGGILAAMKRHGVLDAMRARGLTTLFYFQVDNPLVEIADPVFLGRHSAADADVSVKVCAKRSADEGLGVVVQRGEATAVVEYSELTEAQKTETRSDGRLAFLYGSVAIHVFGRDFLAREADRDLPIHLAHKKVPVCDDSGRTVMPSKPNAFKFEKFIFDVLPHARRVLCVEFDRAEEFSPVKNADGADSPHTARRDLVRKAARWFEARGVAVPRDPVGEPSVRLEVDPCYALDAVSLAERLPPGFAIRGDVLLRDS